MLTEEAVVEIKVLARQGHSIREIARQLSISRNTVRRYLRGEAVKAVVSPGRPRKIAPYEDWLRRRVAAAAPVRLPATALHREIRAMGYDGAERTVRRFVAGLYPEAVSEPVQRFETAPGHQAQMDWGEYRLNGERIYAFVGVLGYSRWLYFEYVESTKAEVLVDCHRRMFGDFGGVPREVLYDNMRTAVTHRDAYGRGRHRFHDGIWSLARDCGFRPKLCRPYRPQTKGKVERSVHFIASSFFRPLITRLEFEGRPADLELLNAEAHHWRMRVANQRVHGTTGQVPAEQLGEDQAAMTPYRSPPVTAAENSGRWPRYVIQRSPREYDAVLAEVPA